MSRLAALKEYAFLTALHKNGFRVPQPVAQSRHTLVMELVQALPLRQIKGVPDPAGLYAELITMILHLAEFGLIHGDFNEFNILIREDEDEDKDEIPPTSPTPVFGGEGEQPRSQIRLTPVLIDFPQMVSIDHANAEFYFDRDVRCIKRFFERRFHFTSDEPGPVFADARQRMERKGRKRLDVEVEASGFSRKMAKELEKYMHAFGMVGDQENEEGQVLGMESESESSADNETVNEVDESIDGDFEPDHTLQNVLESSVDGKTSDLNHT